MSIRPTSQRWRGPILALALLLSDTGAASAADPVPLPPPVGPVTPLVEPTQEPGGLYHQSWFHLSFLNLRDDFAEAKAAGKRFAVIFEQRGCRYCTKLHTEILAQKYINDYVRENFTIVQLDLWGAREVALGFGFRCGFLGLLHLEIVQERLRREYGMDIIATYPSVVYRVTMSDGVVKEIDNPAFLPEPNYILRIDEPMVKAFVISPNEYIGDMMSLISEKRGKIDHAETLDAKRVMMTSLLPLNEILIDFHDRIKSITRGFGSMDYEFADSQESDMVKLEMLVNGEPVDAFSCIVHRDKAEGRGRALAAKLKEVIPHQQYQVAIQAAIGGKVVARETVSAFRKDVTAKCYGGDITRKRKLLEKQKEGKKRMKAFGTVNIPQEAFIEVLKA